MCDRRLSIVRDLNDPSVGPELNRMLHVLQSTSSASSSPASSATSSASSSLSSWVSQTPAVYHVQLENALILCRSNVAIEINQSRKALCLTFGSSRECRSWLTILQHASRQRASSHIISSAPTVPLPRPLSASAPPWLRALINEVSTVPSVVDGQDIDWDWLDSSPGTSVGAAFVPVPAPDDRVGKLPCISCGSTCAGNTFYVSELDVDWTDGLRCRDCLRRDILQLLDAQRLSELSARFSLPDLSELLSATDFDRYLEATLAQLLHASTDFVSCPSCRSTFELVPGAEPGESATIPKDANAPDFSRELGLDDRPLDAAAQQHYLHHRIRCRNPSCATSFCRSCTVMPYHVGFNCETYQQYLVAPHCRFCTRALLPATLPTAAAVLGIQGTASNAPKLPPALAHVCNDPTCLQLAQIVCRKMLPCHHPCGTSILLSNAAPSVCRNCDVIVSFHASDSFLASDFAGGVRDEHACPPCLIDDCRPDEVPHFADDLCAICAADELQQAPVIQLDWCVCACVNVCVCVCVSVCECV